MKKSSIEKKSSISIDNRTMLISNYSKAEREEILKLARDITLNGKIDWDHPIVKIWMETCAHSESQKLMLASTVLPLRLLLSVVE